MKVEKINDNKVRITLSFDELSERNISLYELSKDSTKVQQMFYTIFEETELDDEFLQEDSQLLVEASTSTDNLFVLTVTKIVDDILPDINKLSSKNTSKNKYKVSSNMYSFNSLDKVIEFSNKASFESLYLGLNSLYKYNNMYYIIFKDTTVANKKFIKTFIVLSEFCEKYYRNKIYTSAIIEKGKCIISYRAIQKLNSLNI